MIMRVVVAETLYSFTAMLYLTNVILPMTGSFTQAIEDMIANILILMIVQPKIIEGLMLVLFTV